MADYETLQTYVGYHDANNVSNFGGDSVTQLNLKKLLCVCVCVCECVSESVCPKTCRHIARRMMHMADYETLHVCPVPYCQQCVKFWWWPSDPIKF